MICDHCGLQVARCRACGAEILWARSNGGKAWPLDLQLTTIAVAEVRNIEKFDQDAAKGYNWNPGMWKTVQGHVPHHITCANWPSQEGAEASA